MVVCLISLLVTFTISNAISVFPEEKIDIAPICPPYSCKTSSQVFTNITCAYYEQGTYFTRPCAKDADTCALEGASPGNYTCQKVAPIVLLLSWPGEKCTTLSDCAPLFSSSCTGGLCIGTPEGGSCINSNFCLPGTACQGKLGSMKCLPLIPNGSTGCANSYDCVNSGACNVTSSSNLAKNTCFEYGSFAPGVPVGDCSGKSSNLCSSGYCSADVNNPDIFICSEEFQPSHTLPYACDPNAPNPCTFQSNGFTLTSSCSCGRNADGISYCGLVEGDIPLTQYNNQLKKWALSKDSAKCSTTRRYFPKCIAEYLSDTDDKFTMLYYTLNMNYYVQLQTDDDCVLNTFYGDYVLFKNLYQIYVLNEVGSAIALAMTSIWLIV